MQLRLRITWGSPPAVSTVSAAHLRRRRREALSSSSTNVTRHCRNDWKQVSNHEAIFAQNKEDTDQEIKVRLEEEFPNSWSGKKWIWWRPVAPGSPGCVPGFRSPEFLPRVFPGDGLPWVEQSTARGPLLVAYQPSEFTLFWELRNLRFRLWRLAIYNTWTRKTGMNALPTREWIFWKRKNCWSGHENVFFAGMRMFPSSFFNKFSMHYMVFMCFAEICEVN